MAPGRKVAARSTQPAEAPMTDYEKLRATNMMRNNQVLQRLGVTALASIVSNTSEVRKGDAREESGSLYAIQESDDSEEEEVNQVTKDVHKNCSKTHVNASSSRARASKRVLAPEQQDEPTRVTRQKSRDLALATSSELQVQTRGLTVATPTPQPDQVNTSDEGALESIIDSGGKRNKSMGRELDRITRGLCTKIPIHVSEGKRRPEAPMQAAKLASEGGIVLRNHIPIFTHWKEYKKVENKLHMDNYIGKVAAQFTMDTNSNAIKAACADLLKGGQRQMRYRLKKKYFNGIPANQVRTTSPVEHMTDDQWKTLVKMWSEAKHKEKCTTNQENRGNVRLHQCTGSRCYIAQAHVVKQDKFKDVEPTAVDLFKDFHCSKKTGYSEPVQKAIADIEAIMNEPAQDGQEPNSANEAVSKVVQSTTFLRVAGVRSISKNSSRVGTSSQLQELQTELEMEKHDKEELRQQIDAQRQELDSLKKQAEASKVKQLEEIESLKKKSEDTHSLLRQLLSFNQGQHNLGP